MIWRIEKLYKKGCVIMEFHEKLQELRKSRGLTQEELAQDLYVSRTAISKWESGRGYPSIDSLKEISNYFSVTIDDLLSSEKLLSIAEKENKSNLRNMCDLIFGIIDIGSFILILLQKNNLPVQENCGCRQNNPQNIFILFHLVVRKIK